MGCTTQSSASKSRTEPFTELPFCARCGGVQVRDQLAAKRAELEDARRRYAQVEKDARPYDRKADELVSVSCGLSAVAV